MHKTSNGRYATDAMLNFNISDFTVNFTFVKASDCVDHVDCHEEPL